MDVVLYTREGCDLSHRIKELLKAKGVHFREYQIVFGVDTSQLPIAVIDGVAIPGNQRATIEQAIGWIGS